MALAGWPLSPSSKQCGRRCHVAGPALYDDGESSETSALNARPPATSLFQPAMSAADWSATDRAGPQCDPDAQTVPRTASDFGLLPIAIPARPLRSQHLTLVALTT